MSRLVYSTDSGRRCPDCGQPVSACRCKHQVAPGGQAVDGVVRLQRQTKGRAGKPVVIITGLALTPDEMKQLAKRLKSKCGVGGTVEQNTIIMQGDKRDLLKSELEALGHTVKLAGG